MNGEDRSSTERDAKALLAGRAATGTAAARCATLSICRHVCSWKGVLQCVVLCEIC